MYVFYFWLVFVFEFSLAVTFLFYPLMSEDKYDDVLRDLKLC